MADLLLQNKELHERRWARGSFVRAIQGRVRDQAGDILENWVIWLCLNSDNDRTAIWLEQKFYVPDSGTWTSEYVFTIPASERPVTEGYPGLLVFECTPLEEVEDEIERFGCFHFLAVDVANIAIENIESSMTYPVYARLRRR